MLRRESFRYRTRGRLWRRRHWPVSGSRHMSAIIDPAGTHTQTPCEIGNSAGCSCRDSRCHFTPRSAAILIGGGSWGGSDWSKIKSRAMLLPGGLIAHRRFLLLPLMMLSLKLGNAVRISGREAGSRLATHLSAAFLFQRLFGLVFGALVPRYKPIACFRKKVPVILLRARLSGGSTPFPSQQKQQPLGQALPSSQVTSDLRLRGYQKSHRGAPPTLASTRYQMPAAKSKLMFFSNTTSGIFPHSKHPSPYLPRLRRHLQEFCCAGSRASVNRKVVSFEATTPGVSG